MRSQEIPLMILAGGIPPRYRKAFLNIIDEQMEISKTYLIDYTTLKFVKEYIMDVYDKGEVKNAKAITIQDFMNLFHYHKRHQIMTLWQEISGTYSTKDDYNEHVGEEEWNNYYLKFLDMFTEDLSEYVRLVEKTN